MSEFESGRCKGTVSSINNNYDILIEGVIAPEYTDDPMVHYSAPAPTDTITSFTGSGLPYASKSQAFYNSPNVGQAKIENGRFRIVLKRPNSYYGDFNTVVHPSVTIRYNYGKDALKVALHNERVPYRSLQYPMLRKAKQQMFYAQSLPVRSQEQVLRDSAYTDLKPEHSLFWGLKPAV